MLKSITEGVSKTGKKTWLTNSSTLSAPMLLSKKWEKRGGWHPSKMIKLIFGHKPDLLLITFSACMTAGVFSFAETL